jgi:hypothetical protein
MEKTHDNIYYYRGYWSDVISARLGSTGRLAAV